MSYFVEEKLIAEGSWENGELVAALPVDNLTYSSDRHPKKVDQQSVFKP